VAGNELLFFIDDAIDISSAFKPERVHLPVLAMVIGVERHHRAVCLFIRVKQYGGASRWLRLFGFTATCSSTHRYCASQEVGAYWLLL
jgi:hypothetical protein